MKLRGVILKNYRGYYHETKISISNLTALIGKNDVGKSTILEALECFFNQSKIELEDKNILHQDEDTVIGCIFDDLPDEITLEEVTTSLSKEYLLNPDGNLEIRKIYSINKKPTVWIYANHPSNEGFSDLLSKKNNELKTLIRGLGLEAEANLTINSEMRQALWNSLGTNITLEPKLISAENADDKKLWPKLEPLLPSYRLFKADRPSTDEDQEAQDPMQQAMKIALQEQQEQLASIAEEVQTKVAEVAHNTILKLSEFDPALASTLTPKFKKDPMWEKAFSFSLTGDDAIPLNKRGSGIRRLVLFSFFRATTESTLFTDKDIIYAIEEPETSQHPDAQRMIVNTFREMIENTGCQIIITTHVPGLAGLLSLESLRYIYNNDGQPTVTTGATGEENGPLLTQIADELGVFPDFAPASAQHHEIKLIVCVEGPHDIEFITAISRIAHDADNSIIDLETNDEIIMIPLGGSILKEWVNRHYLRKLGTPEYHIYDSDNSDAHSLECARVNQRNDGSSARQTHKREMENYIHSDIIKELFDVEIDVTDTMDVSTEISNRIRATNPTGFRPDTVKKKLNRNGAKRMTMELLHNRDPEDEVLSWLREISEFVQCH